MIKNKIPKLLAILFTVIAFSACKKAEYNIGDIVAPTNLVLTAAVVGTDAGNPFGNGTGKVDIVIKADNALTYKIDFGDGNDDLFDK